MYTRDSIQFYLSKKTINNNGENILLPSFIIPTF